MPLHTHTVFFYENVVLKIAHISFLVENVVFLILAHITFLAENVFLNT